MPGLGATDGGSAAERARARLQGGGGAASTAPSPYQIPIRTGGFTYRRPINQGQFDDDDSTTSPKVMQKVDKDIVDRFDLTDEGVNAAMGTWYGFEDEERAGLAKKMWFLGLLKDPNDFSGAYKVWQEAVTHAGKFALKGREMDPRSVLDMMGDATGGSAGGVSGGRGGLRAGPTTRRQIDFTDPETAKAWVQQAFQQSMGRAAEEAEVRALMDALGRKERENPTVTTTTPTRWDENGNAIESDTVTSGGFSSDAFIQNQVDADPESTAHQAAGELYPALLAALGAGLS